jgi:ABC-type multidrug transport system ATPase subunit
MRAVGIEHISKSYEEVQALNDIHLDIEKGELFGFIGPDGAGKTTLFRLIVTLLVPDSGSIDVLGYDSVNDYRAIRRICGYMPGQFSLYQDLSVEENLQFFATAFGTSIRENYHLIKDIYSQIEPFRKRLAGKLSGGMKQKLALSCALIHKPELLVLDEPTTGVDAVSRREFWEMLAKLRNEGLSIIVSTPYMDEASLCDRVALIQEGNILKVDTPEGVRQSYSQKLFRISAESNFEILKILRQHPELGNAHMAGEYVHLASKDEDLTDELLARVLIDHGKVDAYIDEIQADIEDCFIDLMTEHHE